MSQGPEARLRTRIVKALRSYGGMWFVVHGGMYQSTGISDVLGCHHGKFWSLEVKRPGREHTLTERQAQFLRQVKKAGGHSAVVTSVDEAIALVFGTI